MELKAKSNPAVIPASCRRRASGTKAGIQDTSQRGCGELSWIPACAGMTLASGTCRCFPANPALAHTGAEHAFSFASGFKHPFTGLDHMLAMVAVGLWAGLNGGRALWAWPVAFVGVMVLGGALGISGFAVPMVEAGILASVVVLGLLVLAAAKLPVAAGAILVAAFALLHGHAHGAELPGEAAAAILRRRLRHRHRHPARHRHRRFPAGRQLPTAGSRCAARARWWRPPASLWRSPRRHA